MTGWCCVYVSDPGSLEVARLAVELRCSPTEALGWLVRLWTWALVQAPDGSTARWGDALGAAVGWHGDSAMFRAGLLASGALTEQGEIVGWGDRYKLRRQAERQARLRDRARDATVASPSADGDALQDTTGHNITEQEKERDTSAERSPSPSPSPAPGRAPRARRPRLAPEGPHEADPADTETEIVAEVPSTQGPVRVRRALVKALRATAPGVDVDLEVRRAAEWSAGNPTRRKTASGVRRFLASWMARQQDRGAGGGPGMGQAPRGPYRGSQRPQTQAERIAELEAREAAGTMGPGEAGELTRWRLRHLGGLELVAGGVR